MREGLYRGLGNVKIVRRKTYTLCGTPEYLAPKVVLNKGHGKGEDWRACRLLLYKMLVGKDPFNDEDPVNIYLKILKGVFDIPPGFDSHSKDLIKHLLEVNPNKRYRTLKNEIKDITEHSFFKNTEWDKILKEQIKPPYIPKIKSDHDLFIMFPLLIPLLYFILSKFQ